ncbi:MAG: FRG domain-containing protein [Candidatus Sulfotelmatobacter sp.]
MTEKIEDIAGYLRATEGIVKRWSDHKSGTVRPWYRGQSDASWGLQPGEYRPGLVVNPDQLRSEFQLRALPLLRHLPHDGWEWYFLMQHYGLPTRLLDWTTGSLLGLYFAVRSQVGLTDAAVWVLDPWQLNKENLGKGELLFSHDRAASPYLPRIYARRAKLPDPPVAMVPPHNSDRITVQRGAFTVHGDSRDGIEQAFTNRLVRLVIPKLQAVAVKRGLRMAGIGEFTVFPELVGLCDEIRAAEIEGF